MVRAVAQRVTDGRGFELVDVEVKRSRDGHMVRLFVDKEGGIGLDELQSVSEEVSAILDAEDPIDIDLHPGSLLARPGSTPQERSRVPPVRRAPREAREL